MEVLKFGGASVENADGVRNVLKILSASRDSGKVVVVSAMGKTTNALEKVVDSYFKNPDELEEYIASVKRFHTEICLELFDPQYSIFREILDLIGDLISFLQKNTSSSYDYVYDQVVCYGELLSTLIISRYFSLSGLKNTLVDARNVIKTDSSFRDAKVDWNQTEKQLRNHININGITVTQGFIGTDNFGNSTTLGREGSDYSAGIIAYCLDAQSVTVWKNVAGILNADPAEFEETTLLKNLSYHETIELAFYGAKVIHPKTLQPLQRKDIPLYVRCFYHPEKEGTIVSSSVDISPKVPCFIVKKNLTLLSLSTLDFSFFVEENISEVFGLFHQFQAKVHIIQNSAISFSVCIDDKFNRAGDLIACLQKKFKVSYHNNVSLYTIRHFDDVSIDHIGKSKLVLLEQRTRKTVQFVVID